MPLIETTHEEGAMMATSPLPRRHHGKRLRRWLHGKEGSSSQHGDSGSSLTSECSSGCEQQTNSSNNNKRRSIEEQSAAAKEDASGDSSFSSTNVEEDEDDDDNAQDDDGMLVLGSPTIMHSLSDTEVMGGGLMSPSGRSGIQRRRSVDSTHSSERSYYSTKRKGVKYARDGSVVCCRFCEILRARDEDFLYEDELITVFRPLAPVVDSHILVVPRCHIRNVNMLTKDHLKLLRRMKEVAAMLLQQMPPSINNHHTINCLSTSIQEPTSQSQEQQQHEADYKFAFHTPPFNSIDHVHMHAFRRNEGSFGCFGAIKYRTETWWCRSFEEVISRLAITSGKRHRLQHQQNDSSSTMASEEPMGITA
ncbi:hypothetical protein Gpo141_00004766 [Globisporangium polare]